jgi:hypothetical protein
VFHAGEAEKRTTKRNIQIEQIDPRTMTPDRTRESSGAAPQPGEKWKPLSQEAGHHGFLASELISRPRRSGFQGFLLNFDFCGQIFALSQRHQCTGRKSIRRL